MSAVTSFTLTQNHLDNPDNYAIRLETNSGGKIICPIYLNELEVGSTVYKVHCCNRIFPKAVLERSIRDTGANCPVCRRIITIPKRLTLRNNEQNEQSNFSFVLLGGAFSLNSLLLGSCAQVVIESVGSIVMRERYVAYLGPLAQGAGMLVGGMILGGIVVARIRENIPMPAGGGFVVGMRGVSMGGTVALGSLLGRITAIGLLSICPRYISFIANPTILKFSCTLLGGAMTANSIASELNQFL